MILRSVVTASFAALAFAAGAACANAAPAPAASPSPAPSSAPSPAPPVDICSGGISAIVTRPSQTTSVCVVKQNHVLIETGYQTQTAEVPAAPYTFQTVPSAEIRVGTAVRNVELDVFPPSSIRSGGVTALADTGAGIKWQIASSPTFAYGVNVNATAPTGTNASANPNGLGSAGFATYTYNLNVQGSLGPVFGYGATLGLDSLALPTGQRYSSFVPSLALSATLPSSSSLLGEIALFGHGAGPGTPTRTQYIFGVIHDFGTRLQVDLETGFSPTVATGKYHFVGAGVSYYF